MDIEMDGELRRLFSPKITQLHTKVRDAQASLTTQAVAELARRIGDLETANESLHRDVAALEAFLVEQGTVDREVWEHWCSEWKVEAARLVEQVEEEEDELNRSSDGQVPEAS